MKKLLLTTTAFLCLINPAIARETIRVVGSSTVYPFTTAVAENFGKTNNVPTPVVESTGTGGGFKLFCAGVGADAPDAVNASRAIKDSEKETCAKNGVTVTELKLGFDAIVLATSKEHEDMDLTTNDIYRALAKYVLVDGVFVENVSSKWNDIRPELGARTIEVLGPPPTSGTRDSFIELVIEKECKKTIKEAGIEVSADEEKKYCQSIREDGRYVEAGENDNLIVQKLNANPNALGIFGFSFLDGNRNILKGISINGVIPEFETIQSKEYAISRPLYVYFKNEHFGVVPNLQEFLDEYKSERAIGEDGYLIEKGLVPLE